MKIKLYGSIGSFIRQSRIKIYPSGSVETKISSYLYNTTDSDLPRQRKMTEDLRIPINYHDAQFHRIDYLMIEDYSDSSGASPLKYFMFVNSWTYVNEEVSVASCSLDALNTYDFSIPHAFTRWRHFDRYRVVKTGVQYHFSPVFYSRTIDYTPIRPRPLPEYNMVYNTYTPIQTPAYNESLIFYLVYQRKANNATDGGEFDRFLAITENSTYSTAWYIRDGDTLNRFKIQAFSTSNRIDFGSFAMNWTTTERIYLLPYAPFEVKKDTTTSPNQIYLDWFAIESQSWEYPSSAIKGEYQKLDHPLKAIGGSEYTLANVSFESYFTFIGIKKPTSAWSPPHNDTGNKHTTYYPLNNQDPALSNLQKLHFGRKSNNLTLHAHRLANNYNGTMPSVAIKYRVGYSLDCPITIHYGSSSTSSGESTSFAPYEKTIVRDSYLQYRRESNFNNDIVQTLFAGMNLTGGLMGAVQKGNVGKGISSTTGAISGELDRLDRIENLKQSGTAISRNTDDIDFLVKAKEFYFYTWTDCLDQADKDAILQLCIYKGYQLDAYEDDLVSLRYDSTAKLYYPVIKDQRKYYNYFELEDPTIIVGGNSPALLTGAFDDLVEKFEKGVYYVYGLKYTYHASVDLIDIFDRTNHEIGLEKNVQTIPED
ncbi:MAG TPA: hypothetical protein PLG34_11430 [Spirochaetota bacterium]|nr:hypothetical protein [Spirochaetota bacterium]